MAPLAVQPYSIYSAETRSPRRVLIQKPEISTYRPPAAAAEAAEVGLVWKWMVGLTYMFSFITFCFVFTV